jgi:hypothetical protein
MAPSSLPVASLSLDLDNQWSYMKIHGDSGWETFPSYLDRVVPRFLDFLKRWDLNITVFIVGQDAAIPANHEALRAIAQAGHEIGNHSFHHESWMHLYEEAQIEQEIIAAEQAIQTATGQCPQGFRGPGYSCSPAILRVLSRRGYAYDASTFPTYIGPLARAYYFMSTKLEPEEREKRKALFGKFTDGFQPLRPYQWSLGDEHLTEVPVSTLPVLKIPIHFSYLLYLSAYSSPLAQAYFAIALQLFKVTGQSPSLLLHPLDFMTQEDVPELAFFPGMGLKLTQKLTLLEKTLERLTQEFQVVNVAKHARHVAPGGVIRAIAT